MSAFGWNNGYCAGRKTNAVLLLTSFIDLHIPCPDLNGLLAKEMWGRGLDFCAFLEGKKVIEMEH